MASPTGKATTLGLELEFNLAFTESKLLSTLSRHRIPFKRIQKQHETREHESLLCMNSDFSHTCRTEYPAWTVIAPLDAEDVYCNPLLTTAFYNTICPETNQSLRGRGYISEPLMIAQDLLRQGNLPVDIRAVINSQSEATIPLSGNQAVEIAADTAVQPTDYLLCPSADYSKWTLTNDYTLIGSLKSQLLAQLPSKINTNNVHEWDSHGIELISPVFNLERQKVAVAEVERYLSALSSSDVDVGILTSTWAGLHVHVGFDVTSAADIPLETLQWLACILLTHEDLITSLFPSQCSGIEPAVVVEPEEPEDPYLGLSDEEYEIQLARDHAEAEAKAKETASLAAVEKEVALRAPSTPTSASESGSEASVNAHAAASLNAASTPSQTEEERVLQAEKTFTNHQSTFSNARHLASILSHPHPLSASTIYEAVFNPNQTVSSLVSLLQRPRDAKRPDGERYRGYMYNFSNIDEFVTSAWASEEGKDKGKPTVEFRQHECTIDAVSIGYWVRFVDGVVSKAETLAGLDYWNPLNRSDDGDGLGGGKGSGNGDANGQSNLNTNKPPETKEQQKNAGEDDMYQGRGFEVHTDIRRFCTWIGLNEEEGEYWVQRRERFAGTHE